MPSRLPLFPLSVVLFPGQPLPLHIFEPRYRRLLADSLAGDRRFGITPVGEAQEAPEAGAVGCVAEVRVSQELPDGRSSIVVEGRDRFVVARLLDEPLPYLVGLVDLFDDEAGSQPTAEQLLELRTLFAAYKDGVRQLADVEPDTGALAADPATLSFQIAAALELDRSVQQRLLAERSTARRVEALLAVLPALAGAVETALRVRRRAHSNGKGGAHPDVVIGR